MSSDAARVQPSKYFASSSRKKSRTFFSRSPAMFPPPLPLRHREDTPLRCGRSIHLDNKWPEEHGYELNGRPRRRARRKRALGELEYLSRARRRRGKALRIFPLSATDQ